MTTKLKFLAIFLLIHVAFFFTEICTTKNGLGKTLRRIIFRSGFEKKHKYNVKTNAITNIIIIDSTVEFIIKKNYFSLSVNLDLFKN